MALSFVYRQMVKLARPKKQKNVFLFAPRSVPCNSLRLHPHPARPLPHPLSRSAPLVPFPPILALAPKIFFFRRMGVWVNGDERGMETRGSGGRFRQSRGGESVTCRTHALLAQLKPRHQMRSQLIPR